MQVVVEVALSAEELPALAVLAAVEMGLLALLRPLLIPVLLTQEAAVVVLVALHL